MSAPSGREGERRRHHHRHRHDHDKYQHKQQCGALQQQHNRRRGDGNGDLVPLAALISREMKTEKMERPKIRSGCAAQSKKGEDYFLMKEDCQRSLEIFDGHNGNAAAIFAKENLLSHILSAIPHGLGREEWLQALPRALVAGFVKTDKEFQRRGETSGTTATFVIVDRWIVTVASVGDSRCILDTQDGAVTLLTVDHRLEENAEERERVTASGGEVGRLSILGGKEIGPLRCWPGGLCLSRSIGDMDVGEYIVPVPYVKQVKFNLNICIILLFAGRLICLMIPAKLNFEELFEEGSAMLAEKTSTSQAASSLFTCAICQVDLAPSEGFSVHAGAIFSTSSKPWEGPFLCSTCRDKKDAMEGKRPSGVKVV
ncbi:unnamed protein product [Spirodela intermedia]|uniref:protein-serine/threonine phosphatase n=1 Tax=Spirodela intermedia TaxID=51605 RepID=A0A7I8JMI0_SPIIN|nr:unnamed protein product [Spirodela intermedia]CAA6671329.1 unnamed protein product [Spirodela intermedia]